MKTLKKLATLSAAVIMAATAAVPATFMTGFAASGDKSISITDTVNDVTFTDFKAYQIFAGTYNASEGNITVTGWGDGVDANKISTAFANSIFFVGLSNATDFAQKLEGTGNDSAQAIEFAKLIQNALSTTTSGTYSAEKITGLAEGYYIVTAGKGTSSNGDAYSSGLLQVAGSESASVTVKADVAKVEKKVYEDSNDSWQDVADAEQGSEVKFRLYAELPSNYDAYKSYYLKFNDELTLPGFKDQDSSDSTYTAVKTDSVKYYVIKSGSNTPTDITSSVNNKFTTVLADSDTHDNKVNFSFECLNVKELSWTDGSSTVKVEPGDKIIVEYATDLNEGAIVTPTTGNDNAVTLEYSNNPNKDSDGTTAPSDDDKGTTPKDEVRVLTYQENINKIDGATSSALAGAGFAIKDSTGKYATFDANRSITGWVSDYDESKCVVYSAEGTGIAVIKGLDSGTYTLQEKVVPTGYNQMADKDFTITATYNTTVDAFDGSTNPLTKLESTLGTGNASKGEITATISNNKGSELPSTGGMGTTIFYVGGGILVVASGALLISKKRMKNKEN